MWRNVVVPISPTPVGQLQLGINGLAYFDPQQIFLNLFQEASANGIHNGSKTDLRCNWITQNNGTFDTFEEAYLQIDSNGYVTSLTASPTPAGGQLFTFVQTWMLFHLTPLPPGITNGYPTGTYRFQFTGTGTMQFLNDPVNGTFATSTPGVTVTNRTITSTLTGNTVGTVTFNVTSAVNGILLEIDALPDGANYLKNFSLVHTNWTVLYDVGQIFHPNFLALLAAAPFKAFRCMDLLQTNNQVVRASGSTFNGGAFTAIPLSGNTSATLSVAWPNPSGTYLITLNNGQDFQATFTIASTAVAFNGTVGTSCTSAQWFLHAINGWANRPQLTQMSYVRGIPYEIGFLLANASGLNPWMNIPGSFVSADWDSFGQLLASTLNTQYKCYVEWINEVWNSGFDTQLYAFDKSVGAYGTGDRNSYYGQQVSLMADRLAFQLGNPGFDNRCVVVMSGQAASTSIVTQELAAASWVALGNTAPWQRTSASGQKTIKAVAIAPYFGLGNIPSADFTHLTGQGDGGYSDFFTSLQSNPVNGYTFTTNGVTALPAGGWYGLASSWVTNHVTAMGSYGNLPVVCYEGGWQFFASGSSPDQTSFLATAARDSRMAALYQAYFHGIAAAGSTLQSQFVLCSAPYAAFEFGALENPLQTISPLSSAPARFQGIVNFVNQG